MVRYFSLAALLLLVAVVASLVTAQYDDQRSFHTRRFWDGFERRLSEAGEQMQRRIDSNLETAMDHLSNFGDSLGSISRRLEDSVQESLPSWMRSDDDDSKLEKRHSVRPQDAPVEAVMGKFSTDGLDDGLEVFLEGDADNGKLPDPHIMFRPPQQEETEEVFPPRTGGPLLEFPFPNFPTFMRRSPFFWGLSYQPWWRGDNVCMDESEIDETERDDRREPTTEAPRFEEPESEMRSFPMREAESNPAQVDQAGFFFSQMEMKTCSEEHEQYVCTTRTSRRGINKTIRTVYRCCHGHVREESGCTKVDMVPLDESLVNMELTEFLSLVQKTNLVDMITADNITIFAPSNEAVQDFTADLAETNDFNITSNEVYRRKRSTTDVGAMKDVVFSHMYEGYMYTRDMADEQVIPSMNTDSSIRINIYNQQTPPIMTANCAKMIKVNQHSSNGVIHTLDRVMEPAMKTIADIISNDPQFTTLKRLMSVSGMLANLREEGQMTMFAPTDAAFASLPEEELASMMDGSACLSSVMKNHILPNVICSAAVVNERSKTKNLLDKYLEVRLQESGKLFVEDAQVVAKDIMATNGVIHIIDAPLMPSEAKPVLEVLESHNLTRFLELLEIAELTKEIELLRDVSLFAPSNEAIDSLDEDYFNELKNDKERLQELLRYHITSADVLARDIENNRIMDTHAGHPLRVNLYRGPAILSLSNLLRPTHRVRVTAGCGMVDLLGSRACGATVHIIDSLLEPAKDNVLQKLASNPDFSIFHQMVKDSSLAEELSQKGPFTVLAPSDHVFRTLPQEELDSFMEDSDLQEQLVKHHVLREHVCCSGITPNMFPFRDNARTAQGTTLHMHVTPGGLLMAGPARITQCAKPAHNGLVHTVNKLFVEPHVPARRTEQLQPYDQFGLPSLRLQLFGH